MKFNLKSTKKSLILYKKKFSGRNFSGKITVRHKGNGHKRLYRIIDFKRNKLNIIGKIIAIDYDPNRNCKIALILYSDNETRYILSPLNLFIGDTVVSGFNVSLKIGNSMPIALIPNGVKIHNLELIPLQGGKLIRSAGCYGVILARFERYVTIKLPSKEIKLINSKCFATIGQLTNVDFFLKNFKKAGCKRWLGIRPSVRGSAMNAVDHPHGGGKGKASIGKKKPFTPWGKPALGVKTRKKEKKKLL